RKISPIAWVHSLLDAVLLKELFQSAAEIVQHSLIGIKALALCGVHHDKLWNGVYELLKFSLSVLPIFNVCAGQIPSNDDVLIVTQGLTADQKPAILSIFSSQTSFCFPRFTFGDCCTAYAAIVLNVVCMKAVGDRFTKEPLRRQAVIVQHELVCMETGPVGGKNYDVLRECVNELLK